MGNIVGIIPARGGSAGIPLKNIRILNGKPLIAYTIESALESRILDRVIVSTDHGDIARISKEYGAEVPFKRPVKLAGGLVPMESVLQDAVGYLERKEKYDVDAVVLLQPTQPLRRPETIVRCVQEFKRRQNCDSIVTVNNIEGFRPEWMLYLDKENRIIPYNSPFKDRGKPIIRLAPRQSFPILYKQNGVVYVTSRDLLVEKHQVIGVNAYAVITDEEESSDIDTENDFIIVEAVMRTKKGKVGSYIGRATFSLNPQKIQLIVYDFDGVMTDNKAMVDQKGNEYVTVNRSDGMAVSRISQIGIKQIIISRENNLVVQKRAAKLGLFCLWGVSNKKTALEKYLIDNGINKEDVVFVGNDINDFEAMNYVGYPIAPSDASEEIKRIARIITKVPGGCGVVREVLDIILGQK